ncbi:MAG: DNA repair protein RecO [Bacteroidia bacterium]|nr:DNA repair protein RecO [Bacteroidia bacterium]
MIGKTRGIILRCTRYSESSIIASIYTEEFGLLSFNIRGGAKGKGTIRPSHLQPLNLVDMVIYYNPVKSLNSIKELKCTPPLHYLHQDIKKRSVGIFMLEVLNKVIREEEKNPQMFGFIYDSVINLEQFDQIQFTPWFLAHIIKHFGNEPDCASFSEGMVLDLYNGRFTLPDKTRANMLGQVGSAYIFILLQTDYQGLENIEMNYLERIGVISDLLSYMRLHINESLNINSMDVLREVMAR